jgi:hypothetical protein
MSSHPKANQETEFDKREAQNKCNNSSVASGLRRPIAVARFLAVVVGGRVCG